MRVYIIFNPDYQYKQHYIIDENINFTPHPRILTAAIAGAVINYCFSASSAKDADIENRNRQNFYINVYIETIHN